MGEFALKYMRFSYHKINKVEALSENIHFLEEFKAADVTIYIVINMGLLILLLKIFNNRRKTYYYI